MVPTVITTGEQFLSLLSALHRSSVNEEQNSPQDLDRAKRQNLPKLFSANPFGMSGFQNSRTLQRLIGQVVDFPYLTRLERRV